MRAPPPVEFTSGHGRAWRGALALLVGLSVAVPLAGGLPYVAALRGGPALDAWLDALAHPALQGAIVAGAGLLAFAASWRSHRGARTRERTLRWDGQDWLLVAGADGAAEQRGDASLMLDLGPMLLVRFVPGPGTPAAARAGTWLALAIAGDPARWSALRGALWNWRVAAPSRP